MLALPCTLPQVGDLTRSRDHALAQLANTQTRWGVGRRGVELRVKREEMGGRRGRAKPTFGTGACQGAMRK